MSDESVCLKYPNVEESIEFHSLGKVLDRQKFVFEPKTGLLT